MSLCGCLSVDEVFAGARSREEDFPLALTALNETGPSACGGQKLSRWVTAGGPSSAFLSLEPQKTGRAVPREGGSLSVCLPWA